ncbi:MAG: hypothetical protein K2L08_04750 [Erysipelotrichaceae bacterium]|nr:hypothetical protein [Erysipelotrichaceae bacterium]
MNALNILGLNITFVPWDKIEKVPLYISIQYQIKKANINGLHCLALIPKENLPTLTTLKKQMESIHSIEKLPIYIYLDSISYFRKENLLQNNIPFILKEKMVFLPFMATLITNEKFGISSPIKKLTLSAQLLFIWILYQEGDHYFINDALRTLKISNMTLTRAYRQLIATSLFTAYNVGRKIFLKTTFNKLDLFKAMKPYLQSPIKNKTYIMKKDFNKNMVLAGEALLSEYTFINPPQIPIYAVDSVYNKNLLTQQELIDKDQQIEVEIWKYDPLLFSNDQKHIDQISLITSFLNNQDERIHIELEKLLKLLFT